jgi:DNA-binding CsgD family transcriptional regulator
LHQTATVSARRRRLTGVPDESLNAIILSQRPLVRELLGEFLRIRCGARIIAKLGTRDPAPPRLPAGCLIVCDLHGLQAAAADALLKNLQALSPLARVVQVDDSNGDFHPESLVSSVRGQFAPMKVLHEQLTPLELEVMLAVAAGQRNADVARRMRRSCKTVEKHRANLLRKLGVRTVAQLTAYAIHHGLLRADAILRPRRTT